LNDVLNKRNDPEDAVTGRETVKSNTYPPVVMQGGSGAEVLGVWDTGS